jgi:cyclohexa-1,5-dienecarbonyl-CoA hydratase
MTAAAHPGVLLEPRGAVAVLRLDRPPLHVLDIPTIAALGAALEAAEASPASVLVVTSTGARAFSAGVDIRDHTPDKIAPMLAGFHAVFRRLHATRLVTVAAVRGACLGGGMELALSCDIVVAEAGATFGLPEIRLACFPPVGLAALADRWGPRLEELCLTGETVDAAEADRRGLLSRLVAAGGAEPEALRLAGLCAAHSPAVLGLTARWLRRLSRPHFEHSLEKAEKAYLEELARMPDMEEGIRSFTEKRPPRWGAAGGGIR